MRVTVTITTVSDDNQDTSNRSIQVNDATDEVDALKKALAKISGGSNGS